MGELIGFASKIEKNFIRLIDMGEKLTDYAIDIRYPMLLEEPTIEEAKEAIKMAEEIKSFVLKRLPMGEEK